MHGRFTRRDHLGTQHKYDWQHAFAFSFVIEGTTEKVLKFVMPLKSIYNKNIYNKNIAFIVQKNVLLTTEEKKSRK
jgi:hypothetical protein